MKFSPCIDIFYFDMDHFGASTEDMLRGMEEAKAAGFEAVEFWNWWMKDVDAVAAKAKELGLVISTFCQKFITLGDAAKREEYLAALRDTLAVAQKLGVKTIISQAGDEIKGVSRPDFRASVVAGLSAAAPLLEAAGVTLVVEPLNVLVDHAGYWLSTSEESFAIMREVGSPNVKILFDIYHQQITEGNLIRNITENIDLIGHFHAAGNPGRHEIWLGEICYPEVFRAIDRLGYTGYMGLEYMPTLPVAESIAKTKQYLTDNGF